MDPNAEFPCIQALFMASKEGPIKEEESVTQDEPRKPLHPLLRAESTTAIIMRYHQQRAALRAALEECAKFNEGIPPRLVGPLQQLLADIPLDDNPKDHPSHIHAPGPSVPMSPFRAQRGTELSQLIHRSGNLYQEASEVESRIDPKVSAIGASTADATGVDPDHSGIANNAIQAHKYSSPSPPLNTNSMAAAVVYASPKELLERAHVARRNGERRKEILVLSEYLRLGQEGSVLLDTSATTRLLRQLAEAHMALKEYLSAEHYFFDWYLVSEKTGDSSDAARALTCLGNCCHARGDLEAAEGWLKQAQARLNPLS